MKKDKERAQRIYDSRRKGMKPGYCHCCGLFVTELTNEHAPPKRTQDLIDAQYLIRNASTKLDAHIRSKRNLPPAIAGPGGFKFRTFCKVCQEKTQRFYGNAYFEWTRQGLELTKTVTEFEFARVKQQVSIQPLNVIKQMASNALAVSLYSFRGLGSRRMA